MRQLTLLALVVVFNASFAVERPTLPPAGEDKALFGTKSAREFFRARLADTACRKDLDATEKRYQDEKAELRTLLTGGDSARIDAQEIAMREARDLYLQKLVVCGSCATRAIERRVITTPARTEVWYISDGSCQLSTEDTAALQSSYEVMTDSLTHLKQYPKEDPRAKEEAPLAMSRGFYNVLDFVGVDATSGKILGELDKVEKSPFSAFIAVRGPELLGFRTAVSYFIRNQFSTLDGGKGFHLTFQGMRPPVGFQRPEVYEITASRNRTVARQMQVATVIGSWYVNSDGYLRYFTAADFGLSLKFAEELAHEILLDTVAQLSERAQARAHE